MSMESYFQIQSLKKIQMCGLTVPRMSFLEPYITQNIFEGIKDEILELVKSLDKNDRNQSLLVLDQIKRLIFEYQISEYLIKEVLNQISSENNWNFFKDSFAVKLVWPSLTDEKDIFPKADFVHFVRGELSLIHTLKGVFSSLFCEENLSRNLQNFNFDFAILITEMINPRVSGSISTSSLKTNIPDAFDIRSAFGSGEIFFLEDSGFDEWVIDIDGGIIFNRTELKKYSFQENPLKREGAVLVELDDNVKLTPSLNKKELEYIQEMALKIEEILNVGPILIDFVFSGVNLFIVNIKKLNHFNFVNRKYSKEIYFSGKTKQIFKKNIFPLEFDLFSIFADGFLKTSKKNSKTFRPYVYYKGKIFFKLSELMKFLDGHIFLKECLDEVFGHKLKEYDLSSHLKKNKRFLFRNVKWNIANKILLFYSFIKLQKNFISLIYFRQRNFLKKISKVLLEFDDISKESILETLNIIKTHTLNSGEFFNSLSLVNICLKKLYQTNLSDFDRFDIFNKNIDALIKVVYCDENLSKMFSNLDASELLNFIEDSESDYVKYFKSKLNETVSIMPIEKIYDFSLNRIMFFEEKIEILENIKNKNVNFVKTGTLNKIIPNYFLKIDKKFKTIFFDDYKKTSKMMLKISKFLISNGIFQNSDDIYYFTIEEIISILNQTSPLSFNLSSEIQNRKEIFENINVDDNLRDIEKMYHYGTFFKENETFSIQSGIF